MVKAIRIAPTIAAAVNSMARKQDAAAEEHRGKEPVFLFAETIAQHANEPQERNSGERHQIERECDRARTALEPRTRLLRMAGIDVRKSQKTPISRTENTIPAIAAAFGVLR